MLKIALDNAGGVQGLHIDVVGVGEGLHAGEVAGVQLQRAGGQLGHLEAGDGSAEVHVAAGNQPVGLGLGEIAAEGAGP